MLTKTELQEKPCVCCFAFAALHDSLFQMLGNRSATPAVVCHPRTVNRTLMQHAVQPYHRVGRV